MTRNSRRCASEETRLPVVQYAAVCSSLLTLGSRRGLPVKRVNQTSTWRDCPDAVRPAPDLERIASRGWKIRAQGLAMNA